MHTLMSQTGDLPHAYLFVGHKGTGKTSSARILAKALNCLKNKFAGVGTSIEPCNECSNCLTIDASSNPDVIEMDAASNRGIDEVKNLIKEASYAPMSGLYRVFIIDEAHMITNDAFNALLKTLEEPPKKVVFILATTNLEKIPLTIQSRTVILNFGKAKRDDVIHMLRRISVSEKIKVGDDVLHLIYLNSDRSFRDATKLLEELVMHKALSMSTASTFIGTRSVRAFLKILCEMELKSAISWSANYLDTGGTLKKLIEDALEDLRLLLLFNAGIVTDENDSFKTDPIDLSVREIAMLSKAFGSIYPLIRVTPNEGLLIASILVEFYHERKKYHNEPSE